MGLKDFFKTSSETSPKGGDRACLCEDGTYNKECCDGCLQSQGIGSTVEQSTSVVTNVNEARVITSVRG